MNDPLGMMGNRMRGPTNLLQGLTDQPDLMPGDRIMSRWAIQERAMPHGWQQMPPAPPWNPNEPAPQEAEPLAPMAPPPPPARLRSVLKR